MIKLRIFNHDMSILKEYIIIIKYINILIYYFYNVYIK